MEVYYLEACPDLAEGPFLKEERSLIENISKALIEVIEHKIVETEVQEGNERIRLLMDSTAEAMPSPLRSPRPNSERYR